MRFEVWACFHNQVKITVVLERRKTIAFSKILQWISRCNCVYHKVVSTDYQHNYLLCISKGKRGYMFRLLGGHFQAFKVHKIKITTARLYAFFWVITRRLDFICRRFGTLCSIFIGR